MKFIRGFLPNLDTSNLNWIFFKSFIIHIYYSLVLAYESYNVDLPPSFNFIVLMVLYLNPFPKKQAPILKFLGIKHQ